jgi:hypothetical protein
MIFPSLFLKNLVLAFIFNISQTQKLSHKSAGAVFANAFKALNYCKKLNINKDY